MSIRSYNKLLCVHTERATYKLSAVSAALAEASLIMMVMWPLFLAGRPLLFSVYHWWSSTRPSQVRSSGRLHLTLLLLRLQLTETSSMMPAGWAAVAHAVAITNHCMVSVVMGPILPQEAEKRGVGPRAVGMIFSIYAFVNFCVSPYMGKALQRGSVPEPHLVRHHSPAQPSAPRALETPMPVCVPLSCFPWSQLTHLESLSYPGSILPLVSWSIRRAQRILKDRT